jgi:7-cyano-7-deazaguanine reductase
MTVAPVAIECRLLKPSSFAAPDTLASDIARLRPEVQLWHYRDPRKTGPSKDLRSERASTMGSKPATQLTYLGRSTPAPTTPEEAVLDRVPNAHPDTAYLVRFSVPEFTTLCAVTGQPDFARFVIDYVPKAWLIESKSLKFYLASFRNQRAFHEECTITIGKRVAATLEPAYLRIGGYWYPRGGMPIDVFWELGALPKGVWVPDQGVAAYGGRV